MTYTALAMEQSNPCMAAIDSREARDFLYHEARLLDRGRFDAWLDLFDEDGIYWVPTRSEQADPLGMPSIIYENKDVLAMRVSRLMHPRTYSVHPRPRTTHVVGNVHLLDDTAAPDGSCAVASVFMVHEYVAERRRLFSGLCEHRLRRDSAGKLRILAKRVDLVDAEATHSAFLIPF